jgi:Fe-coproporphyrin III synthase
MCYTWQHPSKKEDEIEPQDLETLPQMVRLNITGGEPFLREDLSEILDVVKKKARRVVISSNGFLTKRIVEVMKRHKNVGIRLSVDGIGDTHNKIRGVSRAHEMTLNTLQGLRELGIKDLGIAVTVSDENAKDLVALYGLAKQNCVELATGVLHNAYYFHKEDNQIADKGSVESGLNNLVREYLKSSHAKDWFRGYYTKGLIDHMHGKQRALRCTMATDSFYIDPYGDVRPCNVMNLPFGNIKENSFDEIWRGRAAEDARRKVYSCQGNCWMMGSVGHLMRHKFWVPLAWIVRSKVGVGVI